MSVLSKSAGLLLCALASARSSAWARCLPGQQSASAATKSSVGHLESRLAANPQDQKAARELHLLLATPNELPREESMRLRDVLRKHPEKSRATLVRTDEPGDPLLISGTVRNAQGKPVEGAIITIFHTDAKGFYSPRDAETKHMDEPNSRIFGFIQTGADGRYEFRSVRPGGYPFPLRDRTGDQAFVPQHIHLIVSAPGYQKFGCGRETCQLVFADDPRMTAFWNEWARQLTNPILTLQRNTQGISFATYDITLRKENKP